MKDLCVVVWMVAYNHEKFIEQAIESIMVQQTNFSYKLFIGEDFSKDSTREICENLKLKYPNKIELFLHKINIGATQNGIFMYKQCIKSKAKYIALCEGDDYWTDPLKLQKQIDFLENNLDHNICFHRANLLKKNMLSLHEIPEEFDNNSFHYIELLKHYNFISTASVVLRNMENFYFPDSFHNIPFGDMAIFRIFAKNKKIFCIPEIMSVYRIHDNGIWSGLSQLKNQLAYLDFYKIIYEVLNENEKAVVINKMIKLKKEISNFKFPKNRLLAKIYYIYLNLKS